MASWCPGADLLQVYLTRVCAVQRWLSSLLGGWVLTLEQWVLGKAVQPLWSVGEVEMAAIKKISKLEIPCSCMNLVLVVPLSCGMLQWVLPTFLFIEILKLNKWEQNFWQGQRQLIVPLQGHRITSQDLSYTGCSATAHLVHPFCFLSFRHWMESSLCSGGLCLSSSVILISSDERN